MVWFRRWRFRMAWRLVKGMDGMVVSRVAWQAALDRLATLSDWPENTHCSIRIKRVWCSHVEDVTRLLAIGAEIGDPTLQLTGVQERYSAIRYRAMPKSKRERVIYESALQALEARFSKARQEERAAITAPTDPPVLPPDAPPAAIAPPEAP